MRQIIIISAVLLFLIGSVFAQEQQETFIYNSKGKRDPFISLVSSEGYLINTEPYSDASDINLEGIIYDPKGESFAIINTLVVKTGEKIGEFEVLKIEKNKVILLKNDEKFEIDLKEGR